MRHLLASLGLCFSTVLLAAAASAQFQLQRLYIAPNSSPPPTFLLQGADGNFYGTLVSGLSGSIFKMTPDGVFTILSSQPGLNRELALADDGTVYGTIRAQTFGSGT